eukprot:6202314-Pleurochrysis_carterae.AAC.2
MLNERTLTQAEPPRIWLNYQTSAMPSSHLVFKMRTCTCRDCHGMRGISDRRSYVIWWRHADVSSVEVCCFLLYPCESALTTSGTVLFPKTCAIPYMCRWPLAAWKLCFLACETALGKLLSSAGRSTNQPANLFLQCINRCAAANSSSYVKTAALLRCSFLVFSQSHASCNGS